MADGNQKAPEIVLLKSEVEAAAARVAERALNETWTGAAGFIGDVFGGLVGDRTKQWRTRNLVDALAQTKDHLESKGVPIEKAKALPMGELLVIFEGASKTDDVDLSAMWAGLLSNGMNPQKDTFIDPSFPRLLANLSGLDARLLNHVFEYQKRFDSHQAAATALWADVSLWSDQTSPRFLAAKATNEELLMSFREDAERLDRAVNEGTSPQHVSYSITNLLRLGLFEAPDTLSPFDKLLDVNLDYNQNLVVDTRKLEQVLNALKSQLRLGYEAKKDLLTLSTDNKFFGRFPMPVYKLSGYAKRFLEACS